MKYRTHLHVSVGLTKTETLGAVSRGTFTVVNDPFTKENRPYHQMWPKK